MNLNQVVSGSNNMGCDKRRQKRESRPGGRGIRQRRIKIHQKWDFTSKKQVPIQKLRIIEKHRQPHPLRSHPVGRTNNNKNRTKRGPEMYIRERRVLSTKNSCFSSQIQVPNPKLKEIKITAVPTPSP